MGHHNKICIHAYVSGRVQGVWFRATTKEVAQSLNITGWVRNLPDGRVEVVACGDEDKVNELQEWLYIGSKNSHVTNVEISPTTWEIFSDFTTR